MTDTTVEHVLGVVAMTSVTVANLVLAATLVGLTTLLWVCIFGVQMYMYTRFVSASVQVLRYGGLERRWLSGR